MIGIDLPFEIAAIAIAGMLLLLWYATRQAVEPFARALGDNVPLIGGAIAASIASIVGGVRGYVGSWVEEGVTPLAHGIAAVPIRMSAFGAMILALLAAIVESIGGAAASATSNAVNTITGTIGALVAELQSRLSVLTNLAIPALQTSINYVGSEGLRLYQEAATATAAAIDGVEQRLRGEIGALAGSIDGAITAAEQRFAGRVASIEAGIVDTFDRALSALRADIYGALRPIDDRVGAVEGTIAQELPGIRTQVGTLTGEIAAATELAQETARTLTKEIEECIDPLCDNIKPEIPNIQAALGLLQFGLLATMIADAIIEPIPAAHRTDALVAGPANTVLTALFDPLGAR